MALTMIDLMNEVKTAEDKSKTVKTTEEELEIIIKLLTLNLKLLQSIRSNQVKDLRSKGIFVGKRETKEN